MANEYGKMTDEALEKEKTRLDSNRQNARNQMKEIQEEQDRRATAKKLSGMTDKEKDNLRQVLGAEEIESGEAVGKPKV